MTHVSHPPRILLSVALACGTLAGLVVAAPGISAAPALRSFGPAIEDYARYEGQGSCRPKAKLGVLAFRAIVMAEYPQTAAYGIGRACSIGGQSEHKEGRAWDWGVRAWVKPERRAAADLLGWLLATDEYGNEHAMARRLGIMYVIWNRRMWSGWSGEWEVYCRPSKGACRNEDGEPRHPHRNHVHFSFGWPGARKQTSFWNEALSFPLPEPTPTPTPTPSPESSPSP